MCFTVSFLMQALVEKDWLAFGHPFCDRVGMPPLSGSELTRQSSSSNFPPSPVRQSSGSFTSQPQASSHAHTSNNYSPIFLQVCSLNIFYISSNYCSNLQLTGLYLLSARFLSGSLTFKLKCLNTKFLWNASITMYCWCKAMHCFCMYLEPNGLGVGWCD